VPTMRAVEIPRAKGALQLVEREVPAPGPGAVLVKVEACGICHSDSITKDGLFPWIRYPRVPGHEIAGRVDTIGPGVTGWSAGDRVGIGWHGGHCGYCDSCRRGDFVTCQVAPQIPGITYDGGYADYIVAPAGALARIPEGMPAADAAPLMCAGVTTFNSLRHSGASPGDLVAVLGIGGLGHLGIQYAAKMGFATVAIARGQDKAALAGQLGARHYIDSEKEDVAAALTRLGGARVVLATVTSGPAMQATIAGLRVNGKLIILGAAHEPLSVAPLGMIGRRLSITAWPSGSSIDSQDTMAFSAMADVRSMNEVYPLAQAADAYERMMSGKARFRVVLTT
jgi:D-arabinose 1-dehydrogenase-like Zn-dependent alcohol dehydrogenase